MRQSQITVKAIRDTVEKTYKAKGAVAEGVDVLGEQYQKLADTLDTIMQAQLQTMEFCRKVIRSTKTSTKEKLDASKLLMQCTEKNRQLVASTIQFWQKVGIQPPKPEPVRRPPDLSIPPQPKYNGPPEPGLTEQMET